MTRLAFALSLGWILALAASLLPPAYGTARGDAPYRLQPIVRLGDLVGDVAIKAGGRFEIGALNDNRQVAFVTQDESGAKLLIQYTGGTLTPLVLPGRAAPGGTWSDYSYILSPVSMNQQGNVAFAALVTMGDNIEYGTFRWDAEARRLTAIALPGMPAVNNRTFSGAGGQTPVINNENEIAFVGEIQNAAGTSQPGVFLLGRDGKLRPVALPDQELPGGGPLSGAFVPSLNDAGAVAFFARRPANRWNSLYVWENNAFTALPMPGTEASDGRLFAGITAVKVNNANHSALVAARFQDNLADAPFFNSGDAFDVLYRFVDGQLTPLVMPGQAMPGGGKFKGLQYAPGAGFATGVSFANDAGQHAFLARLEDGTTAAYRIDADSTLSLILKGGDLSDMGEIKNVGSGAGLSSGIGLNNKGQVAVTVQISGVADTMVLVTPNAQ